MKFSKLRENKAIADGNQPILEECFSLDPLINENNTVGKADSIPPKVDDDFIPVPEIIKPKKPVQSNPEIREKTQSDFSDYVLWKDRISFELGTNFSDKKITKSDPQKTYELDEKKKSLWVKLFGNEKTIPEAELIGRALKYKNQPDNKINATQVLCRIFKAEFEGYLKPTGYSARHSNHIYQLNF